MLHVNICYVNDSTVRSDYKHWHIRGLHLYRINFNKFFRKKRGRGIRENPPCVSDSKQRAKSGKTREIHRRELTSKIFTIISRTLKRVASNNGTESGRAAPWRSASFSASALKASPAIASNDIRSFHQHVWKQLYLLCIFHWIKFLAFCCPSLYVLRGDSDAHPGRRRVGAGWDQGWDGRTEGCGEEGFAGKTSSQRRRRWWLAVRVGWFLFAPLRNIQSVA